MHHLLCAKVPSTSTAPGRDFCLDRCRRTGPCVYPCFCLRRPGFAFTLCVTLLERQRCSIKSSIGSSARTTCWGTAPCGLPFPFPSPFPFLLCRQHHRPVRSGMVVLLLQVRLLWLLFIAVATKPPHPALALWSQANSSCCSKLEQSPWAPSAAAATLPDLFLSCPSYSLLCPSPSG